ncbi:MAG TPA: protoporphyrinogen oxidase [Jatrophihabitantaceae bacterium]
MRVVVIGAGISGLAAAWHLAERDPAIDVQVLDAASTVGGKLRTASVAGRSVDVGAESMLARRPEGIELARAAGLGDSLIAPLTTSAAVFAGGAAHPLPARTMLGIPADVDALRESGVLDDAAVCTVQGEPDRPPLPALTDDVAVGALVRERLGDEVADRLVEPLLGGVYAGRADRLSLRATMPALAARLGAGGSLVRAAQAVTDVGPRDPAAGPVFTSIEGGLGRLAEALAASGKFAVRTGVTVRAIRRTPTGFALDCGPVPRPELIEADGVIVAAPAPKAAKLVSELVPTAGAELSTVDTASMAIVTFAFDDVTLPPGSGLLVAASEGRAVKAVTLSSQKWPNPADGLTVLRASVGRIGETADLQRDDVELTALVLNDLRALIGVDARPVDSIVTRWGGGLPQYAVGHVDKVARIRAAVAAVAGLAVCGATYDGVGIPACIASARTAADQVLAGVTRRGQ